jgi:Ca-activated chloride channel family protein
VLRAFDVSNSMAAGDLEPSRLEAAKRAARGFVERQPSTILIGVVAFGDGAVVVQQPTGTAAEVLAAIDRLSIGGGTSLGQGLFASLNAIAGEPLNIDESALASDSGQVDIGYYGSASIIVLSDGENTGEPDPLAIADLASVAGVQVHSIGIGTEDGTVVEIDGFNIATALDRSLLGEVAARTQGTYYEAADAASLADIYGTIDLELTVRSEPTEVSALFTAGGALLLVVGALLSVLWFGRVV